MPKFFSNYFFKDENRKAYKYSCAETFDHHAPGMREGFLIFTGTTSFLSMYLNDTSFKLSACVTLGVALVTNAFFIDLLAVNVPDSSVLDLDEDVAGQRGHDIGKRAADVWNKNIALGS